MNKNLNNVLNMEELDFVSHTQIHGKQNDIAKQPYINHLLRVRMFAAKMLRNLLASEKISNDHDSEFTSNVLQTAMLHDVLEDCDVSKITNNQELQNYWKNIPDNAMQAMQRLNKNNYPSKDEYVKNILAIDTPLHSIMNSSSNQETMDIVPYIVLVVKMADTLDNMNIFRLTNSIHTFAKLFSHHIENYSKSVSVQRSSSDKNSNSDNDNVADINYQAIQMAFNEFNELSNDKKLDFIIHQLTNEYNQGNAFTIKTINRLNDYWHNWQKYVNTYYSAFNNNKQDNNVSVTARSKLADNLFVTDSVAAKFDNDNTNDTEENSKKHLNIQELISNIKGQYVLLDINLYDIENLNKTAKQLYWIDDIYSEDYHTIQKQICCVKDSKRKLKLQSSV